MISALLAGTEWQATRAMMCRTLGLTPNPEPVHAALTEELDHPYRRVAARLPQNLAVRYKRVGDRNELMLTARASSAPSPMSANAPRATRIWI
jgi:hypothetical protein